MTARLRQLGFALGLSVPLVWAAINAPPFVATSTAQAGNRFVGPNFPILVDTNGDGKPTEGVDTRITPTVSGTTLTVTSPWSNCPPVFNNNSAFILSNPDTSGRFQTVTSNATRFGNPRQATITQANGKVTGFQFRETFNNGLIISQQGTATLTDASGDGIFDTFNFSGTTESAVINVTVSFVAADVTGDGNVDYLSLPLAQAGALGVPVSSTCGPAGAGGPHPQVFVPLADTNGDGKPDGIAFDLNGDGTADPQFFTSSPVSSPEVPVPCTFTVAPTSQSFTNAGGTGTVTVTPSAASCAWTAASNAAFITVTQGGACTGTKTVTYSVASSLSPASRTGTLTIAGQTVTITQSGAGTSATPPFGTVDTPTQGATGVAGSLAVTGWTLDDIGVTGVRVLRDPVGVEPAGTRVFLGDAVLVTGARPDVAAANPTLPFRDRAGWGYLLLTNMLPNQGNGAFTLYAFADDGDGHSTLLGSRTFTGANSTATKPFGAIDTPGQGETISGAAYINFGWALTPLPKTIPVDGSTIGVFVDGLSLGRPTYNQFRSDIASLFPGFNNSNGAVGLLSINTTTFTDGVHTISWNVGDSAGAIDGIGSRYFTIKNVTTAPCLVPASYTNVSAIALQAGAAIRRAGDPIAQNGIGVRRGYGENAPFQRITPDRRGVHTIASGEMIPLVLDLVNRDSADERAVSFSGYLMVGSNRTALPIGSTLDTRNGLFWWQPGPGFVGRYHLLFERTRPSGLTEQMDVVVQLRPGY